MTTGGAAIPVEAIPLEVVVLSDGDPAATRRTAASADWAARTTVLERSGLLPRVPDVDVVACDWQDDAQARQATTNGPLPLLIAAAGERLDLLDRWQLDRALAAAAGGHLVADVWTPGGWEVRLHSPGPDAAARIGSTTGDRIHAVAIASDATGPGAPSGWRRPPARRVPEVPELAGSPFVIAAPPYSERSAGIVALHSLCDRLNRLGYAARLCPIGDHFATNPAWETPLLTLDDIDEGIVVYPEIVRGNPLRGRQVVRWLLNRPGHISGEEMAEDHGDLVITYSSAIAPGHFALPLPVVDPDVFFPKDVPGAGALVWAGKATARPDRADRIPADAVPITRTWPADRTELAALLRRADVLYSLDSLTALNLEATLCGTPVVLFPDDTWDRATIQRHDAGTAGLGWDGVDDLETVRAAAATAYDRYLLQVAESDDLVHRFVRHCADHFLTAHSPGGHSARRLGTSGESRTDGTGR